MTTVEGRFTGYEITDRVAAGSTGVVWKAFQPQLHRVVAIKELAPQLRDDAAFVARFRAEAHLLARLDHPNIVTVYDYVEDAGQAWIVEEWVDGAPLASIGRLTAEQSLGVLRGALSGLAHAHERGLVHRDVTPANILVDLAGTSRLVDFGLAAPTGTAGAAGTPAYMSPEAALGGALDARSDVYSAAAVLFGLLTGAPPYPGTNAAEVLAKQVSAPVPTMDEGGPKLRALLARALAKQPGERPADAAAFLAELEEAAEERYGAGWFARASVTGAVAATTGTAIAGAASTAGPSAGATTVIAGDLSLAPPLPPSAGGGGLRRGLLKPRLLVVAAVAGVVAVAGTAAAVTLTGDDDPAPTRAQASPSPSATTTNPADLAKAAGFAGAKWTVVNTITRYEGWADSSTTPPGTTYTRTWTSTSTCADRSCPVKLTGQTRIATIDVTLAPGAAEYSYRTSATADCVDPRTNVLSTKNGATVTDFITFRVTKASYVDGRWTATAFTGERGADAVPTAAGLAGNCKPAATRVTIVGTRVP